jgi:hypothetical protein
MDGRAMEIGIRGELRFHLVQDCYLCSGNGLHLFLAAIQTMLRLAMGNFTLLMSF